MHVQIALCKNKRQRLFQGYKDQEMLRKDFFVVKSDSLKKRFSRAIHLGERSHETRYLRTGQIFSK